MTDLSSSSTSLVNTLLELNFQTVLNFHKTYFRAPNVNSNNRLESDAGQKMVFIKSNPEFIKAVAHLDNNDLLGLKTSKSDSSTTNNNPTAFVCSPTNEPILNEGERQTVDNTHAHSQTSISAEEVHANLLAVFEGKERVEPLIPPIHNIDDVPMAQMHLKKEIKYLLSSVDLMVNEVSGKADDLFIVGFCSQEMQASTKKIQSMLSMLNAAIVSTDRINQTSNIDPFKSRGCVPFVDG
jgi:hypothetical protein